MILAVPEGYISVKDAFERLLNAWGDGDKLVQAINHASDYAAKEAQNAAWRAYEDAARRVELIMRDALSNGRLSAMIVDEHGRISKLDDHESWREMALFPLGMATVPEPVINPGPVTEGRPVFFQTAAFEEWMSTVGHSVDPFHTGMPGKPTGIHLIKAEHDRRLAAGMAEKKVSREANDLLKWYETNHPGGPKTTQKTIENAIRGKHPKAAFERSS